MEEVEDKVLQAKLNVYVAQFALNFKRLLYLLEGEKGGSGRLLLTGQLCLWEGGFQPKLC